MRNRLNKLLEVNKKQIGALLLAFTMAGSMSACKKESSVSSNNTTATTVETTTKVETTKAVETTTVAETTVDASKKYIDEAESFYEANKEFFVNEYGEDKEYAIKEINDIILVITNDSETITNEELREAFYAMDNIFMPTNVIQAGGNYLYDEPIAHVENVPNLGRYVQDEQAKKVINDNTAIINNFINAMNSGNKDEMDKAKELLLQRTITIENDLDEFYYLGEISNGDELALNMSLKGLVNLSGSLVENGVVFYKDANGVDQRIFLLPDARGAAIINTFAFAEEDGIPYDVKEITENGEKVLVNGRYVEFLGANGFERQFVSVAERNTILDTLAITKYNEATEYLENDFSRISSEYHMLNPECDKSLTK